MRLCTQCTHPSTRTYLRARPGQKRAPAAPEHEEGDAQRGEEEVGEARVVLQAVVCVPALSFEWVGLLLC